MRHIPKPGRSLRRSLAAAAAGVLAATALAAFTPPAQAATSTCHAAWKTLTWSSTTLTANSDVVVYCPPSAVWIQLVHPTSQSSRCTGYGGSTTRTIHITWHPDWSWTPIGTHWRLVYCGASGSGYVPQFVGTGGGGSW